MITLNIEAKFIRAAMANQAKKDIRYYLCGILIAKNGDIVGTNGHTLYQGSHIWNDCDVIPRDMILSINGTIPASAYMVTIELDDIEPVPEGYTTINPTKGIVRTDNGKVFTCEEIDGKYPDYKRVIPPRLSDESLYSNAIALNTTYLARAEKTFGKDSSVIIYHRGVNESIRIENEAGTGILVIMPLSSNKVVISDHLSLSPKTSAPSLYSVA